MFIKIISNIKEINNYGLKFNSKNYSTECLSDGWSEQILIISDQLKILLLRNGNQSGTWFFDENNDYFSSEYNQLTKQHKEILHESALFFLKKIISSFKNNKEDDFVGAIKQNKFFLDQLSQSISNFGNVNIQPTLFGVLDGDFRRSQKDLFHKKHIAIKGNFYFFSKTLVLSDFGFCSLYFSEDNDFAIIFETTHFAKNVGIFISNENKLIATENSYKNLVQTFFNHVIVFNDILKSYFSKSQTHTVVLLRNSHIGHNIWNDISALYSLEKKGFYGVDEIIFYGGKIHDIYGPIEKIVSIPSAINLNYTIKKHGDIAPYVYGNNLRAIRLADDFIPIELANRVIDYSINEFPNKFSNEQVVVVLGLRFENRTWINQEEGLLDVVQYLASMFEDLVVIVDGHDYCGHSNLKIESHMESKESSLINKELFVFEKIKYFIADQKLKINLINAINNDIRETISLINAADFFIAPWGAGLAKYKWICNKPGIVFTSRWNLLNKGDLHIYDIEKFREGAIPSVYIDSEYVKDLGVDTVNTRIPAGMESTYSNFYIDPIGIKNGVNKLIENNSKLFNLRKNKSNPKIDIK